MSADVYMTGDGRDLRPTDKIADTESTIELIVQQADTNLSIAEGEWPTNILDGIDWIGYFTDKEVNVSALAQEVARTLEEIPNIAVRSSTGQQVGRVVQIFVEGIISQRPFRLTVLGQQDSRTEVVGDNAVLAPLVLQWGFSGI